MVKNHIPENWNHCHKHTPVTSIGMSKIKLNAIAMIKFLHNWLHEWVFSWKSTLLNNYLDNVHFIFIILINGSFSFFDRWILIKNNCSCRYGNRFIFSSSTQTWKSSVSMSIANLEIDLNLTLFKAVNLPQQLKHECYMKKRINWNESMETTRPCIKYWSNLTIVVVSELLHTNWTDAY